MNLYQRQGQVDANYCYFYTDTIYEFKHLLSDDVCKQIVILFFAESPQGLCGLVSLAFNVISSLPPFLFSLPPPSTPPQTFYLLFP
jgi:hypothetical protein